MFNKAKFFHELIMRLEKFVELLVLFCVGGERIDAPTSVETFNDQLFLSNLNFQLIIFQIRFERVRERSHVNGVAAICCCCLSSTAFRFNECKIAPQ